MADNVNIIVQDTINDIVVNAAVVVETIDINVQAAVDVVDIVANPNNYVVNINRIIGEQVQSDWTQTDNQAPDYIKNKPTIPAAQVNSDWDATTGVAQILNKPTLATVATSGSYNDLINKPTIPAAVTKTSDLINDGENGVDPFITAADIPPVTGFVPYTGATANVDLGEYELKAGQVTLDTSPTGTAAVATTRWNNTIGSTETTLKGGSVVLKNGVDLVARVVNKVTPNTTLTKAAYQAVRISGAQGQRLAVAYAQANNDNNSADTIGIVCETIATNQEGFILTVGQLEEINTTGSLQGETWADGDVLYLSPTTAGRLTNIKPTGATGHIVVMGYVEYAHDIHGKIYVKIMNGWELDELHNVYINAPANNQGLFYDSSDSLWKNETIASALGYTPFQLPALTSGSVLFSDGTTIAQKNASFFWDNTNNRLGIGTNAPAYSLDVLYTSNNSGGNNAIRVISTNSAATAEFRVENNLNYSSRLFKLGSAYSSYKILSPNDLGFYNSSQAGHISILNDFASGLIKFAAGASATSQMTLFSTGNLAINTTTDTGFRLDVNGTARVSGTTTITPPALTGTAATSALDISQTWNTTGIPSAIKLNITDTASNANSKLIDLQVGGTSAFTVDKTGNMVLNLLNSASGFRITNSGNTYFSMTANSVNWNFGNQASINASLNATLMSLSSANTTAAGNVLSITNTRGATSGIVNIISMAPTLSPTSGTGVFNGLNYAPTINQTGGANGITRGLFINPTLTSAADFRAIEVANGITILGASTTAKASLRIPSGTAPTTPTNGDIWFDGTDLKMRIGGVTKTFTLI